MALRKIITEKNYDLKSEAVLHKKCNFIEQFDEDLKNLIADLTETLHKTDNAVGLAAPQIGVLKRVTVIDIGDGSGPVVLINPEIVEKSESCNCSIEGCLSYPGRWALVERPDRVKVKTFDENGNINFIEAADFLARAFCHEIDHLNGLVFLDKAQREFSEEEMEKLMKQHEDELKS